MRGGRSVGGVLALLALAACDPAVTIQGRVIASDGSGVAGATVALRCPPEAAKRASVHGVSAVTQGDGSFVMHTIGCLDRRCTVEAKHATRGQASIAVDAACKGSAGFPYCSAKLSCNEVGAELRLVQ